MTSSVCFLLLLCLFATVSAYYSSWYEVAHGRHNPAAAPRHPLTIEDMMSGIRFRRSDGVEKRFHWKFVRGLHRQPEVLRQRLFGESQMHLLLVFLSLLVLLSTPTVISAYRDPFIRFYDLMAAKTASSKDRLGARRPLCNWGLRRRYGFRTIDC